MAPIIEKGDFNEEMEESPLLSKNKKNIGVSQDFLSIYNNLQK